MTENICEHIDCSETRTRTEKVMGRPLALCADHGYEFSFVFHEEGKKAVRKWMRENLKPESRSRWEKK